MFSWKKAYRGAFSGALLLLVFGVTSSCQLLGKNFDFSRQIANDAEQTQNEQAPNEPAQEAKYFDRLADYTPYKYEVLFTDPECGVYEYTKPVRSQSGKLLKQKPENVYCKNKYDLRRSGDRPQSPQYRLIEWINKSDVKEIFFTYLSFRNKAVKNALCEAAKKGVKIRFVMSVTEDQAVAQDLIACNPDAVQMKTRGQEGDLGFAHNKFFIVNPGSNKEFKIVFSSGNMTSGPVIHHENWNFITTHPNSHFAQAHICAMNAEWDEVSGRSRKEYIRAIKQCREAIKAPEEKDIKVFFVPGEGEPEPGVNKKTAVDYLLDGDGVNPGINQAKKIWLACHRFFYGKMISALNKRMSSYFSSKRPELKIVADDDTFYVAKDSTYTIGDTMKEEYERMENLAKRGAQLKFMETNGEEHQLHHSKYLIFADYDKQPSENSTDDFKAVFTGSANLTGAGFNKNWENSYYITIPEVVKAFADHYVYTWDKLATAPSDLPQFGAVGEYLTDQPIIKKQDSGVQQ